MSLLKSLFGTSVVGTIINIVVFLILLAVTLNYFLQILSIENGKFQIKNLKNILKNMKEHFPDFAKSLFITIFVFGVLGVTGALGLLERVMTGFGAWVMALVDWFLSEVLGW